MLNQLAVASDEAVREKRGAFPTRSFGDHGQAAAKRQHRWNWIRRIALCLPRNGFAAVVLICSDATAMSETWPARHVRLIVGNGAGSLTDLVARVLSDHVSRRLDRQIFVENILGGSGVMGTLATVRSPADGYSLFFAQSGALAMNPYLYKGISIDQVQKLEPAGLLCVGTPFVFAAHAGAPFRSIRELIAHAQEQPRRVSYAIDVSSGAAGVIGQYFAKRTNLSLVEVPYRSTTQAIQDTVAGRTDLFIGSAAATQAFAEAGSLKLIGATSREPFAGLENVEVIGATVSGFRVEGWFAIVAPEGTPADVIERMNKEINESLKDAELRDRLTKLGCAVGKKTYSTGEIRKFILDEQALWKEMADAIGRTPQ
jgi:tripartite-type tricarboxylate transporter receptor subunit TctC